MTPQYYGGSQLIGDTILGRIRVISAGQSADIVNGDPTYGFKYGCVLANLNITFDEIATNGGDVGIACVNGTDVRGSIMNPVGAGVLFKCIGGGSVECPNLVLDTPSVSYFDIDDMQGVKLGIKCLTPLASNLLASGYACRIGYFSNSSWYNVSLDITALIEDGGTNAGVPAMYLAYTKGSKIDLTVTNYRNKGNTGYNPITQYCTFGLGVDFSNELRGSIDRVAGSIFNGTIPGCGIRVWNANVNGQGVGGFVDENGNYRIRGAAAPTSGTWNQGDEVIFPAAAGQPRGAVCVAGGTPGTWKNYGTISS